MHTHLAHRAIAPPFKYIADIEETPSKERAAGNVRNCLKLVPTELANRDCLKRLDGVLPRRLESQNI